MMFASVAVAAPCELHLAHWRKQPVLLYHLAQTPFFSRAQKRDLLGQVQRSLQLPINRLLVFDGSHGLHSVGAFQMDPSEVADPALRERDVLGFCLKTR